MKAGGEFGWEGSRGPEDLRGVLQEWKVPPPPREIEEELRRTFRRRRSHRRPIAWLAVAASLTLLLVYQVGRPWRPTPAVVAERPVLKTPPRPPVVVARPLEANAIPEAAARAPRAAVVPLIGGDVIVEPRQAELLAQLARQLQGARQAPPGVSLPRIEAVPAEAPAPSIWAAQARDAVLPYRAHWEKVGDVWPFVHRPL
jgi:hypothetical protein